MTGMARECQSSLCVPQTIKNNTTYPSNFAGVHMNQEIHCNVFATEDPLVMRLPADLQSLHSLFTCIYDVDAPDQELGQG